MPLVIPFYQHKDNYQSPNTVSVPLSHSQLMIFYLHTGEKLLYCVEKYGATIVVGQTGCGKTTRMSLHFSTWSSISSKILARTSSISSTGWLGWWRACHCMYPTSSNCRHVRGCACRWWNWSQAWGRGTTSILMYGEFHSLAAKSGRIYHSIWGC